MTKSLRRVAQPDIDPEDIYFGDADSTAAKIKGAKKAPGGREHYEKLVKRSRVPRQDDMGEGKYAGQKSSRAALGLEQAEESLELSETFGEYGSISSGSNSDAVVEDDDSETGHYALSGNHLLDELKQLQEEEEQELQVMSTRTIDEAEKGRHVKNQYGLWDMMLDVRVHMQPLLSAANRLPTAVEILAFDDVEEVRSLRFEAVEGVDRVIDSLMMLQEGLLDSDKIDIDQKFLGRKRISSDFEASWRHANQIESALLPFCKESLDKWYQKMVLGGSESSAKKQLRVINQGVWQQMELAMRDRERLLSRTRILRQSARRIACPEDDDFADEEGNRNVFPDIFDDTDFYQHLVREWVESHPSRQAESMGISVVGVTRGKAAASSKQVDTRASKGRKMRYDAHEKLVNYMVPMHCGPTPWCDEKISEFFASFLAN